MLREFEEAYKKLLAQLPLTTEGVEKTPVRAAKALADMCSGYTMNIKKEINGGIFPHRGETWVSVNDIEICSLCEHHLLPFFGSCFIA
jgi:GTP cyclohydrolase I